MSQHRLPDLSGLPPEIRQKVEQQLAKMSPEMRQHFLANGLPQLLQRMLPKAQAAADKLRQHAPAIRSAAENAADTAREAARQLERMRPHGHFNATIRPGDHPGAGRWLVWLVFVALVGALVFR